jgi:hypothetical protein
MPTRIQVRRDTATNWTSTNPTLFAGEIGFETDTGKMKIGDGSTAWASLAYSGGGGGLPPDDEYGFITVDTAAGNIPYWSLTPGSYGGIEVSASNPANPASPTNPPRLWVKDGNYGGIEVYEPFGGIQIWTVADDTYGQVDVSNTGLTWTVKIGSTADLPIKTGADGALEAGAFGTSAGQFAEGNHSHSDATTSAAGFMSATDKTKLNGIADGAQVNVKPDWNATPGDPDEILNKPTLGTAAASDTGDFAAASHSHGNINSNGEIGATSGLVVKTTTDGAVTTLGMGTAGQVLKVNSSATDIEWGTDNTAGSGGDVSTDTIWDAKGDLAVGTAADTAQKLAAGTDGQYLVAASGETTGLKWQTLAIGSTSGLPIKTGTSGALEAGAFGTSAGEFAEGNHSHSDATTSVSGFMSATDKTKLNGIAEGAQVNVKPDWNATPGDPDEILNKPTLGTAAAAATTDFAAASHAHGNITNAGAIGITSGLPIKTGASGVLQAGAFGSSSGEFAEGNHTHTITDCYCGHIEAPEAGKVYTIDLFVPYARTVTRVDMVCGAGSIDFTLKNDANQMVTADSISTTKINYISFSNATLAAGAKLTLTIDTVASGEDLQFTIRYTQAIPAG